MKLFRMGKYVLVSLALLGTLVVLLASIGSVHATILVIEKEHHPVSSFRDPSGTFDGYLIGQTVTFHIHLNVTTSFSPFPWLSISNLTVTDTLPNLGAGTPTALFASYVSGSQNSSSAHGAAVFTDFGNGTLQWNFGAGPFVTGVLAPPPFSSTSDFYTASVTFNATIVGSVPDNTFLINACVASYTETASHVPSAPAQSDVIWVPRPILSIVKGNPAKVENGSSFNYVLQLSNTGHEDATGIVVQDMMPTGITHDLPATATSGSFLADTPTNVTWTGTIANVTNSANTVNITIPVTANTPVTSVFNSAGFIAYPSDTVFTNQNANCTTGIIHPAISLTKTPSASKIEVGSSVTYNYTVTNSGDTTLAGVSVTDNQLGIITSDQTLTAGQSTSFTKTTTLTDNTTNTATATGVDQTGANVSANATAFVQVIHPAITLTKTPSASKVETGSLVNYTYVVTNTGDTSLTVGLSDSVFGTIFRGKVLAAGASSTTVISEVLTADATNLATTIGVDQTGASVNANATAFVQVIHPAITLTKTPSEPKIENGSSVTYTYTVTNTGDTPLTVGLFDNMFGTIFSGKTMAPGVSNVTTISRILTANTTNVAMATGVDQTGASVNANATGFVQVVHPAIALTKTPSPAASQTAPATFMYTYVVTNVGDVALSGVTVYDQTFNLLILGPVSLPIGGGASGIFNETYATAGNYTDIANATGTDQTGAKVNAFANATVVLTPPPHPKITLTKTPSSPKVENGTRVTYTYNVTNTGDTTLTVSLVDNQFGTLYTGLVLAPGASNITTISKTLLVNTTNIATATGVDQTGASVTANATGFVQVIHPAISLTKTPSASKVENGSIVNYTYVATNTGDTALTVSLYDNVFGTIFTGKVLAAGASNTTVISELLITDTTCQGSGYASDWCGSQCTYHCSCPGVSNVAKVVGVDQTGACVNASATAFVQVIHPAITLTKTACPATSQGSWCGSDGCGYQNEDHCGWSGGASENGKSYCSQPTSQAAPATFVYTYTVTNTGDTTLTGITVFDQTFNVQITLGTTTLKPGQSTKGTYTKTYTSAGTYTNTANATGTDQLGGKVTAFANATVTVTQPTKGEHHCTEDTCYWNAPTCGDEYTFSSDNKCKDSKDNGDKNSNDHKCKP